MIYFDSDMSKSTNTVVGNLYLRLRKMSHTTLPMEKSVTFTGTCANEIIPSINRSFVYKVKAGHHVRIINKFQCIEIFQFKYSNKSFQMVPSNCNNDMKICIW
jgi:hypothetical protein